MNIPRLRGDEHKDFEVRAGFPVEWDFGDRNCDGCGGVQPDDPLSLDIAIGHDEPWESAIYRTSLVNLVDEMIESLGGESVDKQHYQSLQKLSAGFKALAAKLDSVINADKTGGD